MFPCLRGGRSTVLRRQSCRPRTSSRLVWLGSITSSMYPRSAATYGFANPAVYSARRSLGAAADWVLGPGEVALVDDVHGCFGTHHGNLSGRPREVQVGAHLLGRHDAV